MTKILTYLKSLSYVSGVTLLLGSQCFSQNGTKWGEGSFKTQTPMSSQHIVAVNRFARCLCFFNVTISRFCVSMNLRELNITAVLLTVSTLLEKKQSVKAHEYKLPSHSACLFKLLGSQPLLFRTFHLKCYRSHMPNITCAEYNRCRLDCEMLTYEPIPRNAEIKNKKNIR